ncbi:MAG: geranylgeranyl reductase family protein [Deltaproteobacteria bacterium]|nr:geranylgeranyl reductase family protein [Deltaproteobacteria bacterium]
MRKRVPDAVIVGAGPAGSTAAFLLAANGLRVVILDRSPFPREKLCGGLLTRKTIQTLAAVFGVTADTLRSEKVIRHESRGYLVGGRNRRPIHGTLDYPFHLVDRTVYDHFWLERAVSAGAEFRAGARVIAFNPSTSQVVTSGGDLLQGKFVLGADGVASRVRSALRRAGRIADPRGGETAIAIETFVPRTVSGAFPDYPCLHYGYIPWGYAWSFPAPERQALGILALRHKAGHRVASCFRDFLSSQPVRMEKELRFQSRSLPYGNYLATPGWKNTLLLGDAAGLADPFLGEGIYYAHRSAQLAADAILETRSRPESALQVYRSRFLRILYPELRFAHAARRLIFSLPLRLYYPVVSSLLRAMPKIWEETIQGQRRFRWLKKLNA